MNKRTWTYAVILFLIVGSFSLFLKLHYFNEGESLVFEIKPGQTASEIAQNLKNAGRESLTALDNIG